jgi:hypothetical protein
MTDGTNLKSRLKILSSIFIIFCLGCSNSTQLPTPEKILEINCRPGFWKSIRFDSGIRKNLGYFNKLPVFYLIFPQRVC